MERTGIVNMVIMSGRIVSIKGDAYNGNITIACPTIVNTRRQGIIENKVRINFPSLAFNKNTKASDIPGTYHRGDYIQVNAFVQTYLRMNDSGDTKEVLNIYIQEISPQESKMWAVFGKKGRIYPDAKNEVYLSGSIAGISKRSDSKLELRIDVSDERKNIVNAVYYHVPKGAESSLSIGAKVDLLATIQTVDTKQHQRIRNYQDLVIQDLVLS